MDYLFPPNTFWNDGSPIKFRDLEEMSIRQLRKIAWQNGLGPCYNFENQKELVEFLESQSIRKSSDDQV